MARRFDSQVAQHCSLALSKNEASLTGKVKLTESMKSKDPPAEIVLAQGARTDLVQELSEAYHALPSKSI